ncbi:mucin-4-like [Engraulis encrasicolus]|uniref:mucin-4-like n=1 Tax=Engraulis encrasicolus TaxID=184585 RepID=UPI002FD2EFAA
MLCRWSCNFKSTITFLLQVYKAVTQSKVLPEKQQKRLKQSDRKGSTSSQEDAAVLKQSKTTVGFQSERSKTSSAATCSKPVTGPSAATPGRVAQTPVSVVKRAGAAASEGRKGKLGARQSPSSPRCNRAAPAAPAPASTPASPAARAQAGSSRQLPSSMAKLRLGSSSNQATSYGDAFHSGGGGGRVASSKASGVTTRAQAAAAAKTPTKTPVTTTGTAATKSTASSIKPAASTTQRKLPARPTRTLTPQSVSRCFIECSDSQTVGPEGIPSLDHFLKIKV